MQRCPAFNHKFCFSFNNTELLLWKICPIQKPYIPNIPCIPWWLFDWFCLYATSRICFNTEQTPRILVTLPSPFYRLKRQIYGWKELKTSEENSSYGTPILGGSTPEAKMLFIELGSAILEWSWFQIFYPVIWGHGCHLLKPFIKAEIKVEIKEGIHSPK